MAQPPITAYFNVRKRVSTDDFQIPSPRKLLILEEQKEKFTAKTNINIEDYQSTKIENECKEHTSKINKAVSNETASKKRKTSEEISNALVNREKNQTTSPKKIQNAIDKVHEEPREAKKSVKLNLVKHSRLGELKASLSKFEELQNKLKEAEKVTSKLSSDSNQSAQDSNFEVQKNLKKIHCPKKLNLGPKKNLTARKNALNLLSSARNSASLHGYPSKGFIEDESFKTTLKLPIKYRYIAEMFRAIDTICQLYYNRKETITLSKLKPAVENLTKQELSKRCLGQIKRIYPEAFKYHQEKFKELRNGKNAEKWELVITPLIKGTDQLTTEILLARRRVLYNILVDKVIAYHNEFLMSLEPPMIISKDKIMRWHPGFDIEKIPYIEEDNLPEPPQEMKITSGQEVLKKARGMFSCNSRMLQALERLKSKKPDQGTSTSTDNATQASILQGIPKYLLEKVRQRQAAKALISITRTADKEEELKVFSRLPELARLTKNIFISEKKNVKKLDDIVDKLENCYGTGLTKTEIMEHIKLLVEEFPKYWVLNQFHNKVWFLKLTNRNFNLNAMKNKLEASLNEKYSSIEVLNEVK